MKCAFDSTVKPNLRHLRLCKSCTKDQEQVARQNKVVAILTPYMPFSLIKDSLAMHSKQCISTESILGM